MTATTQRCWHQTRRRTMFVGVACGIFLVYVASYYYLSRRGIREARAHGQERGFFYVPYEEAVATEDLARHNFLRTVYAPLNELDADWLSGDEPIRGVIWRLAP